MNDKVFISIVKSLLKQYYQQGKSVGLELDAVVAQFRQEIEDECLSFKYKKTRKKQKK